MRDVEPLARVGRAVRWQTIVYCTLSAIPILAILCLPAFASQDGGLHLASAAAVDGLFEGRWPGLLEWKATVSPNLTIELVLVALLKLFSADMALRITVIAAMIFFAVAVAALVRSAGGSMLLAVLFLPFQANYLLNAGLLGFVFAVPLAIYAVALAVRQPNRPPRIALSILLTVTWFTHFIPAIVATFTIFLVVLAANFAAISGSLARRLIMATRVTVCTLAVSALPIFALTLAWLLTSGVLEVNLSNPRHGLGGAFRKVVAMTYATVSYVDAESWMYRYFALVLYVLALAILAARRKLFPNFPYRLHTLDGLLLAAIMLAISAIVIPDASSTGAVYVASRISLFSSLMLVAWIVSQLADLLPRLEGRILTGVKCASVVAVFSAICVVVVVAAIRLPAQEAAGREAVAIRAVGGCIPKGATIIQLRLADESRYSSRVGPVVHEDGFLAATQSLLALDNESGFYPFYQWKFADRARVDSFLLTERSGSAHVPPAVDLGRAMRGGFPLDAVVLYGRSVAAPGLQSDLQAVALQHDLEVHFRLVEQAGDGLVELWLRRDLRSRCSAIDG
ncbi:MAG TPA: hypothetical protein VJT72_24505 [Pseudonocardiaceae bacterium]|nr:hypothetical protein [Pseudonocardiaceae bacterium]